MKNSNTERVTCNLCGTVKSVGIVEQSPYTIVRCVQCGLVYLSPRPKSQEVKRIYSNNYFNSGKVASGYTNYSNLSADLRKEAYLRLQIMQRYIQAGSLLDAGCGQGSFLVEAKKHGYTVMGCDIASSAVAYIKRVHKLPAVVTSIKPGKLPEGPFDVITSWDVIEHMIDPKESLRAFHQVQKKSGYLFMTTPDINSVDARILGAFWYGFKRIPEHLYYFSPATMRKMLEDVGYEVVLIRPWGFQRNLAYCIDQIGRYSKIAHALFSPVSRLLHLDRISLFFPFIDMMVVARKK